MARCLLVIRQPYWQPRQPLGLHQLRLELEELLPELGEVGAVLLVPGDQLLRQQVGAELETGDLALCMLVLGTQAGVLLLKYSLSDGRALETFDGSYQRRREDTFTFVQEK